MMCAVVAGTYTDVYISRMCVFHMCIHLYIYIYLSLSLSLSTRLAFRGWGVYGIPWLYEDRQALVVLGIQDAQNKMHALAEKCHDRRLRV